MAVLIAESKYNKMRDESEDVLDIFLDDTKNSEQTIQLISQVAEASIALQGMSEIPSAEGKAIISAVMVLDIAVTKLKAALVEPGV